MTLLEDYVFELLAWGFTPEALHRVLAEKNHSFKDIASALSTAKFSRSNDLRQRHEAICRKLSPMTKNYKSALAFLTPYIRDQLKYGFSKPEIEKAMLSLGFKQEHIDMAMIDAIGEEIKLRSEAYKKTQEIKKIAEEVHDKLHFRNYFEKEISKFIRDELKEGYSVDAIKRVLISKGHSKSLIDQAISLLSPHDYKPNKIIPVIGEKPEHQFIDHLRNYVNRKQKQGYSKQEIVSALKTIGHQEPVIFEALEQEESRLSKSLEKRINWSLSLFIAWALLVVIFITFISFSSKTAFFKIAFYFSPIWLTLMLLQIYRYKKWIILVLIPIALNLLFGLISIAVKNLYMQKTLVIDVIISLLMLVSYLLVFRKRK